MLDRPLGYVSGDGFFFCSIRQKWGWRVLYYRRRKACDRRHGRVKSSPSSRTSACCVYVQPENGVCISVCWRCMPLLLVVCRYVVPLGLFSRSATSPQPTASSPLVRPPPAARQSLRNHSCASQLAALCLYSDFAEPRASRFFAPAGTTGSGARAGGGASTTTGGRFPYPGYGWCPRRTESEPSRTCPRGLGWTGVASSGSRASLSLSRYR